MDTIFLEFEPQLMLQPYIQSYWSGSFNVRGMDEYVQSVLPNGCIELIVHLTDDHCNLSGSEGQWTKSPSFTLLGVFNNVYEVRFFDQVEVFGVRFFPDGIWNIFGVAPSEFLSTYENGSDVLGKQLADFCARIREAKSHAERVGLANNFMLKELNDNTQAHDYTHLTMQLIRKSKGLATYSGITQEVPISPRQLQRDFKNTYGITISEYMRLTRINAIHNYMLSGELNLTGLSHEMNFSDQSHFIKEFKNYSGLSPKRFSKARDQFIINPVNKIQDH